MLIGANRSVYVLRRYVLMTTNRLSDGVLVERFQPMVGISFEYESGISGCMGVVEFGDGVEDDFYGEYEFAILLSDN